MKKFLVDMSFVFLFAFFVVSFVGDFVTKDLTLEQEIALFEETLEDNNIVTIETYNAYLEDNVVGLVIKGLSNGCIVLIEGFFIIISNLVSILL